LVHFPPFLVCCTKKNLATLITRAFRNVIKMKAIEWIFFPRRKMLTEINVFVFRTQSAISWIRWMCFFINFLLPFVFLSVGFYKLVVAFMYVYIALIGPLIKLVIGVPILHNIKSYG
jgi:hypothetical protein